MELKPNSVQLFKKIHRFLKYMRNLKILGVRRVGDLRGRAV